MALARRQSTPTTWGRLLTAARNLDAAKRDRARERARSQGGSPPAGTAAGARAAAAEGSAAVPRAGLDRPEPPAITTSTRPVLPPPPSGPAHSSELTLELERSRRLLAQSRRLVAQAQELRAVIAELAARWPYPLALAAHHHASHPLPGW